MRCACVAFEQYFEVWDVTRFLEKLKDRTISTYKLNWLILFKSNGSYRASIHFEMTPIADGRLHFTFDILNSIYCQQIYHNCQHIAKWWSCQFFTKIRKGSNPVLSTDFEHSFPLPTRRSRHSEKLLSRLPLLKSKLFLKENLHSGNVCRCVYAIEQKNTQQ